MVIMSSKKEAIAIAVFHVGVSKNNGTPKSSISIGFSMSVNHPFWGTPIFGNTHVFILQQMQHAAYVLFSLWVRENHTPIDKGLYTVVKVDG